LGFTAGHISPISPPPLSNLIRVKARAAPID